VPDRHLVLASASPARLRLLTEAGFAPEVVVSNFVEDAIVAPSVPALVLALSEAKAGVVAGNLGRHSGAVVIGCDSMLDVDGEPHGKPATVDEARARLVRLRGRSAILRTGHCVIDTTSGHQAADVASTEVRFGDYDDEELEAYLATGEALEVAGSFTLDGRSAPFLDGIVGDHGNVIGLSLPMLRVLLAHLGLTVMQFWV
jgi:septum formation protein